MDEHDIEIITPLLDKVVKIIYKLNDTVNNLRREREHLYKLYKNLHQEVEILKNINKKLEAEAG